MPQDAEISDVLNKLRMRLGEAHSIVKAATTVADEGWTDRALSMTLKAEELIHDADHLLQAAFVMNRQNNKRQPDPTEG